MSQWPLLVLREALAESGRPQAGQGARWGRYPRGGPRRAPWRLRQGGDVGLSRPQQSLSKPLSDVTNLTGSHTGGLTLSCHILPAKVLETRK